jgi:hypothetical protein
VWCSRKECLWPPNVQISALLLKHVSLAVDPAVKAINLAAAYCFCFLKFPNCCSIRLFLHHAFRHSHAPASDDLWRPKLAHFELNEWRKAFKPSPIGLFLITSDLERWAIEVRPDRSDVREARPHISVGKIERGSQRTYAAYKAAKRQLERF